MCNADMRQCGGHTRGNVVLVGPARCGLQEHLLASDMFQPTTDGLRPIYHTSKEVSN